jgi:hypothetical protein
MDFWDSFVVPAYFCDTLPCADCYAIHFLLTPSRPSINLPTASGVPASSTAGIKREAGAFLTHEEQGRRCPRNGKRVEEQHNATAL